MHFFNPRECIQNYSSIPQLDQIIPSWFIMSQRSTTSNYHQAMDALDPETQWYLPALPAAVYDNIINSRFVVAAPVAVSDILATVVGRIDPQEKFHLTCRPSKGMYNQISVAKSAVLSLLCAVKRTGPSLKSRKLRSRKSVAVWRLVLDFGCKKQL